MSILNGLAYQRLALHALGLFVFATVFSAAPDALAAVDFSKVSTEVNSFTTWLTGTFAKVIVTLALAIVGYMALFNRISWVWFGLIMVGAFLIFGGIYLMLSLTASILREQATS